MDNVPTYRKQALGTHKFDINAFLEGKYGVLIQKSQCKFTALYLPEELEKIERERKKEYNAFNRKYTSLVTQLTRAIAANAAEIAIELQRWGPSEDSSELDRFMHQKAMGLFQAELCERGYPFHITVRNETYNDFCEGTCSVCTDVITVTLI